MAEGPQELDGALRRLAAALRALAAQQPAVRDALRAARDALDALLSDGPPAAPETPPAPPPPRAHLPLHLGDSEVLVPVPDAPVAPAAPAGRQRPAAPAGPRETPGTPMADLNRVARRARLKAEACQWAVERRRRLARQEPFETAIKPTDDRLLREAHELPDCYLWMLDPYAELPEDAALEQCAALYENLAAAAELTAEIVAQEPADSDYRREAYQLLAEAQSALRVWMEQFAGFRDFDQEEVFRWLDYHTSADRIYVPRYMRLADPADPQDWIGLAQRLEEFRARRAGERETQRRRRNLLNQARYHARRLVEGRAVDAAADWQRLVDAVTALVTDGMPPSDVQLREFLLPLLDMLPAQVEQQAPEEFLRVLREIDRFLATQQRSDPPAAPAAPTEDVRRVRQWLDGRVVVLIGGERQVEAQQRLERELGLAELRWLPTSPHQSLEPLETQIARPEVALVLLMIRFSSHSFGQLSETCRRYGKPLVRLPGGYGTNQVARQIVEQAGRQLEAARSA